MASKISTFHKEPYNHNCYQAVISSLTTPQNPEIAAVGSTLAGGRAPNNTCGALYATMQKYPDQASLLKKKFVQKAGDYRCGIIKDKALSCSDLVQLAIKNVESIKKSTKPKK